MSQKSLLCPRSTRVVSESVLLRHSAEESPPVCFLSYTIHCLHATFNVVGDVTVEQPATGILRTHFHCLEKISTSDSLQARSYQRRKSSHSLKVSVLF